MNRYSLRDWYEDEPGSALFFGGLIGLCLLWLVAAIVAVAHDVMLCA